MTSFFYKHIVTRTQSYPMCRKCEDEICVGELVFTRKGGKPMYYHYKCAVRNNLLTSPPEWICCLCGSFDYGDKNPKFAKYCAKCRVIAKKKVQKKANCKRRSKVAKSKIRKNTKGYALLGLFKSRNSFSLDDAMKVADTSREYTISLIGYVSEKSKIIISYSRQSKLYYVHR